MHDGMNLVAKEYVAAQDPLDPGVLILSEFAGSAKQLDAALLINPHDVDAIVRSIRRALDMPREERLERWASMMAVIEASSVQTWYSQFVKALSATQLQTVRVFPETIVRSPAMVPNGAGSSAAAAAGRLSERAL
jgi:trehalose 6-phosphate synthase